MSNPSPRIWQLVDAWRANRVLIDNAAGMAGSSVVTSVLGFGYWLIAARSFSPETVGIVSAMIGSMGFLGLVGEFGLGTAMMGQVSRFAGKAGALIGVALLLAAGCSVALGLVFVLVVVTHFSGLSGIVGNPGGATIYIIGVGLTGLLLVFDQSLMGLLLGRLQFWRNTAFAACKLGLLALLALSQTQDATLLLSTWVAGQTASVFILASVYWSRRREWLQLPSPRLMKGMALNVLSHHALNLVTQAPGLLLPVLVTYLLSAQVNAAFFIAWTLISVAFLVPASLTTSLFAVVARDRSALARRMRFTLRTSLIVSCAVIVGCLALGGFALGIFNPYYLIASPALSILAFGMPAIAIKYHYIALKRIDGTMVAGLKLLTAGAVVELGFCAAGALYGDLTGLALGWVLASYLEALAMIPPLWRALHHEFWRETPPGFASSAD